MYLSPFGNSQQSDANGAPLSGGKIWTYSAGTSTPATTYTDVDGGSSQTNPIILNSRGIPANPIWLQGGLSYKFVVTDSNDVVLQTVDDIQGVNDPANVTTQDQWVTFGGAPTYVSATSFSLSGDQTPTFQVGRRLKSTNAGGTVYSTITAASYDGGTTLTTVTVTNDSGTLDAAMSAVSYGLLSVTNPSIPANILMKVETAKSLTGVSVDFTGIPTWAKRLTITLAAASTNGTSLPMVQIGDSGGIEATSYVGTVWNSASTSGTALSTGFNILQATAAATTFGGTITLTLHDASNTWVAVGQTALSSTNIHSVAGSKSTSATLDRIRLTMANGTDTWDAGTVGLVIEG